MGQSFNRAEFERGVILSTSDCNMHTIKTKWNKPWNDFGSYRGLLNLPTGPIPIYAFQNTFLCKVYQKELGDNNRQNWIYNPQGESYDYTFTSKWTDPWWNCFQMSKDLMDLLVSMGFTKVQYMGTDGNTPGDTRNLSQGTLDANFRDNYQFANFIMRWGTYYVRFYK